jgi:hypothetical protein
VALACALAFTACGVGGGGGGGGGSDSTNPGEVVLEVEKTYMDSGDLTNVRVEVYDINQNGVILKLRYPKVLRYVKDSAVFYKGESKERLVVPNTEAKDENDRYLVFFFSRRSANGDSYISVDFKLKALDSDLEAFVEVDLDNNDPTILDRNEFEISTPRFSAQQRWEVDISGDGDGKPSAGSGTPTPTPTPAA